MPHAPEEDRDLAARAAAGCTEAFEALVLRYQERVLAVVCRLVADPDKARDLVQETFLKAWRGISGFGGRSAFFTWLYRIARNAVISAGRAEAARPRAPVSLDDQGDGDLGTCLEPADGREGPVGATLRQERKRLVLDAVAGLPDEFREIIVLRDMQDLSYEDIAGMLEIPAGTVRSRLHRARNELKERLRKVLGAAL